MTETRIDVLDNRIHDLVETVHGLKAEIKRVKSAPAEKKVKSAPAEKKVKRTPSNGRPDVCCFLCGGERGEIQHTGDGKMTIICPECGGVYRMLVEIIKKPDAACLCDKGLSDTCLGLCGDKGPDGTRDPLKPERVKKEA